MTAAGGERMAVPKAVRIRTALLSVSDKTGLKELAAALSRLGCVLISTGGTARFLRDNSFSVTDVSEVTGFPEIMDGRVKTLHPKIHGALLSVGGNAAHEAARSAHGIGLIDLLVVNLYPFERTLSDGAPREDIVENIDVGGPAMIRAASKNHERLGVLVDPADYGDFMKQLQAGDGTIDLATRKRLAAKAFAHTASYDMAIANWMAQENGDATPETMLIKAARVQTLRYGENPHQQGAAYKIAGSGAGVLDAVQVQGKELSYNNINDADAALEAVSEFDPAQRPACVIVKHANPCGVALGDTLAEAYAEALACDPVSAFGGILAFNQALDLKTAEEIAKIFTEVILAPGASDEAKALLGAKKNLRLLLLPALDRGHQQAKALKSIRGGVLVQDRDAIEEDEKTFRIVTKRAPMPEQMRDLSFAWKVAKYVKSNAIVFAKGEATVGIGAGQMSRIDSTRIAVRKSLDAARAMGRNEPLTRGAVLASDAFFPFADGLEAAAEAGATAIIQPGGAQRDSEVIAAADRLGLAMVFTGIRHFRH
jgi:phosphoribosylaminoimidazolecarboxamide formyltransferase/IMP cyclohydrolase